MVEECCALEVAGLEITTNAALCALVWSSSFGSAKQKSHNYLSMNVGSIQQSMQRLAKGGALQMHSTTESYATVKTPPVASAVPPSLTHLSPCVNMSLRCGVTCNMNGGNFCLTHDP